MVTLNYNYSVPFRHLSSNSSRIASRCRPEKTFLLVAVFVVSLMVIGGAADVQHAGELEQVVASDHTPYHLTGGAWSILDLSAPQSGYAFAQTPDTPPAGAFVTTWKTTSDNEIITFPANGTYTIDWGDGSSPSLNVENVQDHTYATAGNYTVKISGGLHAIDLSLNGRDNAAKLQSIEQWGNIEWSTMNSAFRDASNMVYNADDAPDLSGVTDMSNMFNGASSFNGDLSSWNVSSVTDMSDMFNGASSFNGDLASWNVSSVTSMSYMFYDASVFNGDLSSWDISSVNYMTYMFNGASSFDQNLGNWYVVPADTAYVIAENTLKVTTISAQNAFLDDHLPSYGIGSGNNNSNLFNITDSNILMLKSVPPAGTYNVNVTASGVDFFEDGDNWRLLEIIVMTVDPENLVENRFVTTWKTTSANESITIPAIGSYTVRWSSSDVASEGASNSTSHVYPSPGTHTVSIHGGLEAIDLSGDSTNAAKLQSIEQWGNIEWDTMNFAFYGASNMVYNAADAPDLSGVDDLSSMFSSTSDFNGDLSNWNVSSVTDMSFMFYNASAFNGDLASWDVSSVTDTSYMFYSSSSFNRPLASWDVSSVENMSFMFSGASSFDQNLGNWYVVPADTTYAISEGTLNVTTISTQNVFLDSNFPSYGIGSGSNNSTLFNITNSNTLMFKGAQSVDTYNVNVTASGTYVFADGNNWRVFAVSVSDDINALPVLTAIGPKSVNETVLLEFNAAATDADNNALSFSLETGYPSGASITSAGEFSWTPTERQDGTSSITIKVSDNKNGTDSDTFTVTVNEVDTAPVLDTITSKDVTRPNTLTFTATASDDDYRGNVTDTVTFSLTGPPLSGASITSAGDFSWTPTANQTGLHDVTVTVTDGTGLTDSKDVAITVTDTVNTPPTTNRPPTADAGSDLSVDEGGSITLQGSGSDPDGNDSDLTYLWSQSPAAPVISFDNQNSATPEITAPPVTAETEITLTLRVDDGTDHATDTMVLTIQDVTPANQAPSADAGNDRQVDEGGSITLQGSGSDPDGNDSDLTYLWSQSPAAPVISFDNRTSATPEITAPSVTAETEITLTLRVDDGTDHATDTMVLTIQDVTPVNQAPSADAGNDRQVDEGGSITLQGSGSDPDGNDSDLTYSWSQSPAAPVISFDNRTSATPEITAPSVTAETEITLTLRVDDGTDHATDTMVLTIRDVTVATVNVGPDQTVKEGATVIMPWTASSPDGESLTYSWQQSPAQPHIILNNTDSSRTTFTVPDVDADTAFTFTLVVTAGQHTVEDSLTITVKNNRPPTVDAGANRTVNERTAVTLSGSASDPDGDTMTYAWTHDSGISVDLTGSDTTRPQFTAPGVTSNEDIVFTFTVKDTASESADDTVTVTVRDVSISVYLPRTTLATDS